jgi:NADH:ubiquinone oxidoreductase subunit 5 (subunit L)/multisubunit Na+/H+ antiporter MnhA subunit
MVVLSTIAVAIALSSLITSVILIIFNRKPESKHRLTRVSTHYHLLAIISLLMLIIAILLLGHIPAQCKLREKKGNISDGMLCAWLSTTVAYTASCALFAGIAVFIIHRKVSKLEMSTTNIASVIRVSENS